MDIRRTACTLVLAKALLGLPLMALAQTSAMPPAPDLRALPEEVLVTSDRNLYILRTQMLDAEKRAYDVFNKYNDERRFMISCSTSQPTGTRFKRQTCAPRFQIDATAAHARGYYDTLRDHIDPWSKEGDTIPNNIMDVNSKIASQQGAYQQKLREVAEQHPEFLEAISAYAELRQNYEAATSSARK